MAGYFRCQEEYESKERYFKLKYYERITGFTYFLAEIFTQLLTPAGLPQKKLKEALCVLLMDMLEIRTVDSLKCAAHVLKVPPLVSKLFNNILFSAL